MFAFGHGFAAASRRVVLSLGFCLAALGAPLAFAQTATNVATITPPSGVTNTGAACIAANGSGAFNSTTGVCTATDSDTVVTPQLTFAKTHTGNFVVGTNGTYTLTVSNTGTAPTSGTITVTDTLPTGLTFVSATGTGWTCSFASPTVTCTSTTVIPAGSAGSPITLTVAVGAAAAPSVTNTARASGGGDLTCPASGTADPRCIPSDPTTVNTPANVAVAKTGPATVTAGTSYQYTLAVSNSGQTASGTNVIVQDQLPAGVIATAVTGANCGTLPSAAGALLTCTIPGPIAAGGSVNVVLTVTAPATGGSITNYAATNPTGTGNPGTPPGPGCTNNATTNCSNATTTVNAPQLSFTKTHTGNFVVGTNGTYTLTVSNTGTAPTTGTITVTDTLPTGLTFVSATGTGWTCSFASPTVTCTSTTAIAAGATGSPITLTVAVGAAAAPSVTNTARASGGGDTTCPASGGTQARCNPSDPTTVTASADVSVTKTLTTVGPYLIGQTVSFNIVVSNAGPSPATNVQVTDTLTNLTLGTVSGACTAFPCTIASIASGSTATITVTGTIQADGAFSNSATATPTETDPNTGNNTGTDGDNTTPTADVSVTKTLTTAGPYLIGQTVSFDIVVSNAGPSAATNVQVTDTLTNLALGTVSGACTALPCTIASIASGSTATITVTGTIQADGAFSNSATATPTETDPNTGNNTGTDGDNTTPTADVSVTKTLTTAGPFQTGQTVTYTVTVANAGPSTATNVQVTDTPTNLTITGVSGGGCTAFPCTIASLASGASVTITVTATINAQGTFQNSTTATTPDQTDPNPPDNTSTTPPETAGGVADVSVVKTLTTAGPFQTGQTVTYTVTVANAGPDTATNVQVTDTPTNLTITGVSGGGCAAFPCTIASLASGASVTITVTATINAQGTFQNSATATTPDQTDPNPPDNTSTTPPETAGGVADVSVVKTLTTAGPFQTGQTVTYTVTVANAGPDTATNVQVTDTPTNLTITGVSGGGCTAFPCTLASLASGASVTITVTATINAQGTFQNSATATTPDQTDPNPPDNTSTTPPETAGGVADVSVVKTLTTAGPFQTGQTVTYTVTVANAGPDTATNVQVTDTPTNLTITGVSGGGCTAFPCTIASLASGASVTITVTATINAQGTFQNSATATTPDQTDPNPPDNTSTTPPETAGGVADVSVVKTLTTAGPFQTGQTVTYTVTVANAGPDTATNVQVTDTPTNLTITGVSGGGCTAFPCTLASLASGASVTITVTATINAQGTFQNSATATTPDQTDPNPPDNTSTTPPETAGGVADVSVVKTLTTAGPFQTGQTVTYTVTVANAGPDTATNVQVTDTPTNLTITGVSGGGCTAFPCTIASLASGASVTITVTATINAQGTFQNSATATTPDQTDPNPPDNTSTTPPETAGGVADVSVVKTLTTTGPILAGQSIQFDIVVANAGPDTATNVQVTDTPTNLTITNVSGGCTSLPCTIPSIASGANVTITVTATVGVTGGAFNNSATATTPDQTDPNTSNNTDDEPGTANPLPIVANDDSGSANGASGGVAVPNVLVNDTLNGAPATLSNVTLTQTSTTNPNVTLDPATGAVNVAPGTPAGTYTVVYQICEQLNPTNCDTANVTVTVSAAPIDAVDDSGSANGASGGVAVPNVLTNDTLNGAAATLSNVTLTQTSTTNPNVTLDPATGAVNVAPGTPAGTYTVVYQICEQLNPTNCDTANVTVTVSAAPIDAVDDSGSANGASGGVAVPNVLTNDTLNGAPATLSNVTLTQTSTTNPNVTLDPATGAVNVAPGTPAGTYTVVYQICEQLNPTNCDTANVTVTVSAAPIDAVDDSGSANGASGGVAVPNVLTNDTLNGAAATLANVTLTQTSTTNPNVTLDPATGAVNVAPGTPAGTYTVVYQICEQLNPTNCDTANVTVTVSAAPIDAVDDSGSANGASGGVAVPNVLTNDTLNGAPATLSNVTLTQTSTTNPNVTLDPATGAVNVAPGTPAGTYTVVYQICEQLNPTNCDTANVTVTVSAAPIDAVDDSGSANGASGGVAVPNVLTNDTLNGAAATLSNVTLTQTSTTNPNVTLDPATGAVNVAPGTPAGTYTVVYQICEQLNPTNCDTANVTVTVSAAPIDAVDDSGSANGASGGVAVPNVLTNDTLNGAAATLSNVTLTQTSTTNPNVTLDPATGAVNVAPGTPAGTYTVVYQICEQLNPTNCDTANVTVTVSAAPIDAVDDSGSANGASGGVAVPNVLTNDTLNGAAATLANVTLTQTSTTNPNVTLDPATGAVNVAPGTPAGTYTVVYQICEQLNPTNCDTANVTVTVSAAPIDAVDDSGSANGASGGVAVPNVLTNDTLNGAAATLANVTLTQTSTTNPNVTLDPATGAVNVAPGTPAGTYTVVYQICEQLNPTNCDTANVTVTVSAAPIDAVDDSGSANGASGGVAVPNVLTNDTLNGAAATLANVTLTQTSTTNPNVTLDPATGAVNVAPGTPAGTYTVVYQICEQLNPTNCDTANVTVTVSAAPIDAVDDSGSANGASGGTAVPNVLTNDTLNGAAATLANVTLTQTSTTNPNVTLDPATGAVNVAPGTPAGTYTVVYQICEQLNPTNCDTANVTVTVSAAPIDAVDDSGSANGASGGTAVPNVLTNDTLNGAAATLANVTLTQTSTTNPNVTLDPATGAVNVAPGTPAGTYTVVYQICEQLNPTNCDTANVTVTVSAAPIDAVDDSGSANGASGGTAVPNVLTNDTLNGAPATLSNVTLTQTSTTNPNVTLDPATGAVNVAPGTPAGTYTVVYQICEQLNPTNCDTANVTVTVSAAPIDAVDDSGSANGASGGVAVPNVLTNDTLNGAPATLSNVTLTQTSTTNPNVTLDPATGAVNVAPGTPAGTYTVVYQICEQLNPTNCDTASVTVTVSAAPITATDDPATTPQNTPVTIPVLSNDSLNGTTPTTSTVTTTVSVPPTNGTTTINPDGTITYTPNPGFSGTDTFTYQICETLNPSNCDTATVTVTVAANTVDAVNDTANTPQNTPVTTPVLGNDTTTGAPLDPGSVTVTTPPANGTTTVNPDGSITYTPKPGFSGTDTYTYQVCDTSNPTPVCDTATVTVTVAANTVDAVNDTATTPQNTPVTTPVLSNDTTTGAPLNPSSVTVTVQPPNGTTTVNPDGTITYTPKPGFSGTDTYTYQVCDTSNPTPVCDTATVTVTVAANVVTAVDDTANTPQNSPVTTPVLGNDTTTGQPLDPSSVTVTTPPTNGTTTVNPDGTITYTPKPGFSGTDTYTYQVCDTSTPTPVCDTATVTVTVQPNVVTAVDDTAETPANQPVTIPVLDNDTVTGAPLNPDSVTITVPPSNGTVTVNDDGTIVYTPNPNFIGTDTFTYQVCDTSTPTPVCDTATVTVNVKGQPPVANPDPDAGTGTPGQPVTIPVLGNDTDPDNNIDPGTVVIVGAPGDGKTLVVPGEGTWQVNPDGTITFTPEEDFVGTTTPIEYTVSDTTGLKSNPAQVSVEIKSAARVHVIKTASPRDVKIGDLVRYTVTMENTGESDLVNGVLIDTPPAGFTYVNNSLTVADRDGAGRLTGTYPISVDQIDIKSGERATVVYLLRVGAGVGAGIHTNHAIVQERGTTISNDATANVQLVADPLLDESLIIGNAYDDRDGDGWQDSATMTGVHVQGGFAPGAYVPNSTTVDRGKGPAPEPDASSPMLHGIAIGEVSGRQSEADTVDAHKVVVSQKLSSLDFTDDFVLTTKQGVSVRMDASGKTRIERGSGDAAKGLTGAEPTVERRVSQTDGGYRVDYVIGNAGIDERGIPGVRIASVEGLIVETDQFGRYNLIGINGGPANRGRNFILKVDPATLPPGSVFTTDNPQVRRITPGLPVRFDFGIKLPSGLIEGKGDEQVEMELGEVMFDDASAKLREQYLPVIDKMAEQVKQHSGGEVVIAAGAPDNSRESQALAYDRAKAVQSALLAQLSPEQAKSLQVSLRTDVADAGSTLLKLDGQSRLLGDVLFDTDKSEIKPEFAPVIEKIAADIDKLGTGTVGVVGHADKRGAPAYNDALALRRAKAVYEAIAAKLSPEVRSKLRVEISDNPTAPVGSSK